MMPRIQLTALLSFAVIVLCRQQKLGADDCDFANEEDQEAQQVAVHLVQASVTLVKGVQPISRVLSPSSPANESLTQAADPNVTVHGTAKDRGEIVPSGSDIWNQRLKWISVQKWHPAGVVSNLTPYREPQWRDVSYISLSIIILLCSVAYPAVLVASLLALTVLVSMCLSIKRSEDDAADSQEQAQSLEATEPNASGLFPDLPVLSKQSLTNASKSIYTCWAFFCCTMPSIMVFGTPMLILGLARPYPQESLIALTMLTSVFLFANSCHLLIFAARGLYELSLAKPPQSGSQGPETQVQHWLILPQYKEEVEVVSMALRSVAQCTFAKSAIGVVLAFEEREVGAEQKAELLKRSFEGQFQEIIAVYHPAGLPNDPPGKASNLCWAFKELLKHINGNADTISKSVLTVADADSEFSAGYFEALSTQYLQIEPSKRRYQMFQSPVFHLKNYHRQPAPVVAGTVFTAMQELSMLADTNAVRFPYSTYSLSMQLARDVGGWDPEWIAEDYHMGIKCFLMTLGRSSVESVMLATMNYVPEEDDSWWGTCMARWTQVKRHALGFSDFSYYFMMLPLVFAYVTNPAVNKNNQGGFAAFWRLLFSGTTLLVRLVNVHVLVGVLSTYGLLELVLKLLLKLASMKDNWTEFLFSTVGFLPSIMMAGATFCTVGLTIMFFKVYKLLEDRVEGEPYIKSPAAHWIKLLLSVIGTSPIYFLMLAYAIWCAALHVLTRSSFEYHVAPKPSANGKSNAKEPAASFNPFIEKSG